MSLLKHLLFLSLNIGAYGKLMLKEHDTNPEHFKTLHNCVASVVYKYYESRTMMFFPNEINESLIGQNLLIKGINATAAIKKKNRLKSYEYYHKFYILLPRVNSSHFKYYNSFVYKAEKSSLILIIWPPNTPTEYVSKVHNNFWKFRLINVASFMMDESGDINVYVFFPFNEKSCGDGSMVQQVDKCNSAGFETNFDLFSGVARLLDFHGCTLKCYVSVQYPDIWLNKLQDGSWSIKGNIINLLDAFQTHYNVSLSYHNLLNFHYNWYFYNISFESVVREHENESYEFGVGAFSSLSRNDNPFVEYMFGTNPECIAWAIPSFAGDRPSVWMTLVSEFPLIVWCVIGLAIATSVCYISVSKHAEDKRLSKLKVFYISLMMIFAITSESPKIKSRFKSVNMFLFAWCVWGLVIRCAYEASLGSLLTLTVPAQQIKSNKELLDRNFRVAGGIKMFNILEAAATDKVLKKLTKRFEILPPSSGDKVLKLINSSGNLAVLQPSHYTTSVSAILAADLGRSAAVTTMTPCLVKSFSTPMVIRKGSFMSELLSVVLNRMFESGLSQYWSKRSVSQEIASKEFTPLALEKLRGVFVFYFVGIGIATLVFIFEIFKCKFQSSKAEKKR